MAARRHSTVFEVLTSVTTSVQSATYPPHEVTGRYPWLEDQLRPPETMDEFVTVVQASQDDSTIAWTVLSPGGRDETVTVDVVIGSSVHGRTKLQVLERLAELADVVQGIYYDPTTFTYTPPAVAGVMQLGGLVGMSTSTFPTDSGYEGRVSLRYEFTARI